ncbi:phosphoglycerate dehydrogenase [Peptostreptococcus faecalis]|uniref:phosphoglycerate dehydrogenase n=1 Tax=Peptostreptococcus faecalis TaxID=2045015 RepID=UPI000C7E4278|nr:phosphoglycerate dehydrogenase [Peptostreptococcus faecalis]
MKALFNVNFDTEKMEKISNLGYEITYIPEHELKDQKDIYDAEVWFTYSGFEEVDIKKFKNLKYIHLTSTGFNHLPKDYILDNNIVVSNNITGYAIPIAESIVMYILEIYKHSHKMFKQQDNKVWKMDMKWSEISGKTVGFLGTGNIAKEAAKRLKCFGVELIGVNTNGRDIENFDKCYALSDSDEFFKKSDVIVGLMPSTDKTSRVLNSRRMDIMKQGSVIVNIGRGSLIDEEALIYHIDKFKGLALDVVESEPLSEESILWEHENVIITPHNSWVSDQNKNRLFETLYNNLESYIKTGEPLHIVKDIKRGY